ncbi:MAG: hypothetical protein ACI9QN_002370 [Arcticibacterium sp.]|jgi:hypothetical protein
MDTIEVKGEVFFVDSLCEDNLTDLISIYKEVFGVVYTLDAIRKKYNTYYLGVSYFGHFARNKDKKAIAFHGAIPYRVSYNGQVELAAQYGDAMTIKNYAGNGFFTLLGKRTDEQLRTCGIRFVYGFPNQNSEYGYLNKMNWQYQKRMHLYKFTVAALPVSALCNKLPFLTEAYKKWALKYLTGMKANQRVFSNSAAADGGPVVIHDADFFRYKSYSDNMICELFGDLVWLKLDSALFIGDVQLNEQTKASDFIKKLQRLCRRLGVNSFIMQWYPGTKMDQKFRKLKEPKETWVVGYCDFNSTFPVSEIRLTYGDLDTF